MEVTEQPACPKVKVKVKHEMSLFKVKHDLSSIKVNYKLPSFKMKHPAAEAHCNEPWE